MFVVSQLTDGDKQQWFNTIPFTYLFHYYVEGHGHRSMTILCDKI